MARKRIHTTNVPKGTLVNPLSRLIDLMVESGVINDNPNDEYADYAIIKHPFNLIIHREKETPKTTNKKED